MSTTAVRQAASRHAAVRRDICSICRNDPDCIYPKDSGRPVTECAEFEVCVITPPPQAAGKANSPSNNGATSYFSQESHPGKYMGLCGNCEDRETCIYPKPEGGVWHCAEYR